MGAVRALKEMVCVLHLRQSCFVFRASELFVVRHMKVLTSVTLVQSLNGHHR